MVRRQGCLPIHHPLAHRPCRPRAAEGQVTGTVHSAVCLCRGWHVSDPLALRAEASSSSTQDQGPGLFSAEPLRQGRTDHCHGLCTSRTDTRTPAQPTVQTFHMHPPEPQGFHLDSSSLGIKLERGQRQKSHDQSLFLK